MESAHTSGDLLMRVFAVLTLTEWVFCILKYGYYYALDQGGAGGAGLIEIKRLFYAACGASS